MSGEQQSAGVVDSVLAAARRRGLLDGGELERIRLDLHAAIPPGGEPSIGLTQLRRSLAARGVGAEEVASLLADALAESGRRQAADEGSRATRWSGGRGARSSAAAGVGAATGGGTTGGSSESGDEGDWCPPHYEILELLGSGAVGDVFRARDRRLGRQVALKVMHAHGPFERERFVAEARHQARIEHDAVCGVYEVGEYRGRPYIAMQLIDGETLQDAAEGLSVEQKVDLVRQVAEGVHAAHRTGLIHRDLKPTNIMVARTTEAGLRAWVVDFGIAREVGAPGMTRTGVVVGTPWYMAPEQISGRDALDRRTDVYGLGTVLYELFAGRPPFVGDSSMVVLSRILSEEPPRLRSVTPELPRDIERIVERCLAKSPIERYPSARALAEDLERYLAGEPVEARGTGVFRRATRWVQRHRALATVSAAALLLALLSAAQAVRAQWQAERAAQLAQSTGREVERLEWLLRASRQLPRHDITPQKDELRRRVEAFREGVEDLGPVGRRAGLYAVGRGALILGQLDEARRHLEMAREAGLRGAEISEALGMTYGLLYERELRIARSMHDPEEGDRRHDELRRELLEPARRLISEAAETGSLEGRLGEAWIAYFNQDDPRVLEVVERVEQEAPWLHEASLLRGRVHLRRAQEANDDGRTDEAAALLGQATESFLRTVEIGRSESRAYLGLCAVSVERLDLARSQPSSGQPMYDAGLDWCGAAIEIDPENAEGWLSRALLHTEWGELLQWRVQLSEGVMELARRDAQRALAIEPTLASAYVVLGDADLAAATEQLRRGEDPRPSLRSAVRHLELCLELEPQRPAPHSLIAEALGIEGRWLQGRERIALQREALVWLERLTELSPEEPGTWGAAANGWLQLADGLATAGDDPGEAIDEAERHYRRALEQLPDASWLRSNLAIVYLMRGREQARSGTDPGPVLESAQEVLLEAHELNPEDPFVLFNLGETDRELARWAMLGEPPRGAARQRLLQVLERGRERYRRGLELAPTIGQAWVDMARFDVMRAELELSGPSAQGGAAPLLERARGTLERALEVDRRRVSAPCELALVEVLEIESEATPGPLSAAAVARGERALSGCLELEPWNADYLRAPLRAAWRLLLRAPADQRASVSRIGVALADLALEHQADHHEARAYRAALALAGGIADELAAGGGALELRRALSAASSRVAPLAGRFAALPVAPSAGG